MTLQEQLEGLSIKTTLPMKRQLLLPSHWNILGIKSCKRKTQILSYDLDTSKAKAIRDPNVLCKMTNYGHAMQA